MTRRFWPVLLLAALPLWAQDSETPAEPLGGASARFLAVCPGLHRDVLLAALDNPDWRHRLAALEVLCLAELETPSLTDRGAQRHDDPAWPVRARCAQLLGRIADGVAHERLERLRRDPIWQVRRAAVIAVAGIAADAVRPSVAFLNQALADPAVEVAEAALHGVLARSGAASPAAAAVLARDAVAPALRRRLAERLAEEGVVLPSRVPPPVLRSLDVAHLLLMSPQALAQLSTTRLLDAWDVVEGDEARRRIGELLLAREDVADHLLAAFSGDDRRVGQALLDGAEEDERRYVLRRLLLQARAPDSVEGLLTLASRFGRRDLVPLFIRGSLAANGPRDRYLAAALELDAPKVRTVVLRRHFASTSPQLARLALDALSSRDPAFVAAAFPGDPPDFGQRRWLARNLAFVLHRLPTRDALRIGRALMRDANSRVFRPALRSLARVTGGPEILADAWRARDLPRTLPHLLVALLDPAPDTARRLARETLAADPMAPEELRILAIQALGRLEDEDSRTVLLTRARRADVSPSELRAALWALDRVMGPEEFAALLPELATARPDRLATLVAAARGARARAVVRPFFEVARAREDTETLSLVLEFASEHPDASLVDAFVRLLRSGATPGLRMEAARALGSCGGPEASEALGAAYRALMDDVSTPLEARAIELESVVAAWVRSDAPTAPERVVRDLLKVARARLRVSPGATNGETLELALLDALALARPEWQVEATRRALSAIESPLVFPEDFLPRWIEITARQGARAGDPRPLFDLLIRDPRRPTPELAATWWDLGRALERVDDAERAARAYERAIHLRELVPGADRLLADHLGPADWLHGRDPWRALQARPALLRAAGEPTPELLAEAERLAADEATVLDALADLHARSEAGLSAARRLLRRKLEVAGPDAETLARLADLAHRAGDRDAARRWRARSVR